MVIEQLTWIEPKGYGQHKFRQKEKISPKETLRTTLSIYVILMGLRVIVGLNQDSTSHPPSWAIYTPFAIFFSFFIARILPRLVGMIAVSTVILSEKGVNLNTVGVGASIRFVPWAEIDQVTFESEQSGAMSFSVLTFKRQEITKLTVALDTVDRKSQVTKWLQIKGVPFSS